MIANLQALRAVAAWMVVAHHLRGHMGEVWAPLGETVVFASGVDLFFVLSGYLMTAGAARRRDGPLAFWRRRAARVAPLYWLVTLTLAAMLAAGLRPLGVADWSGRDLLAALAFLADERSDGYPGPLLGVGWTLTYEAYFYLLFGGCLLFRRPAAVVVLLVALAAAGAALAPEGFAARTYLAPILLEFAAGAALGQSRIGGGSRRGGAALAVAGGFGLIVGAAALSALAPSGDLVTPGGAGAGWRTLCFGLPAALIVAGAVALERAGAFCRNRLALAQGDASYAVYLLHLFVIQAVERAGLPALILAPPLIAAAGLVVYRRVEAPLTRWANALRLRGSPAAPFRWRDSRRRRI